MRQLFAALLRNHSDIGMQQFGSLISSKSKPKRGARSTSFRVWDDANQPARSIPQKNHLLLCAAISVEQNILLADDAFANFPWRVVARRWRPANNRPLREELSPRTIQSPTDAR